MAQKSLKRNIPLIYTIAALTWGRFFVPIIALFYIASQVSITQFAVIFSIFSFVILALEIPSGVLADLLGKRNTLIIARFMYIIEIFLLAFFNGFWPLLLAKVFSGIGVSMTSGTVQAFLYDTLKKQKKQKEHKKVSGTLWTIINITQAVVFIIGAWLFTVHYKLPAKISLIPITIGWILTFFLVEPYKSSKKISIKNSLKHLKEGIIYAFNHKYVKYLIFFSIPVWGTLMVMLTLDSLYLQTILIPIALIGVVAFVARMISALVSKKANIIEEKIGSRNSLYLLQFLTVIAIFTMALLIPYIGILFYFILSFIISFYIIVTNDYINQHIPTSHRATLISIKNMFSQLAVIIFLPIVGYLIDVRSMKFSFNVLGIIMLVYCILLYVYYKTLDLKQMNK